MATVDDIEKRITEEIDKIIAAEEFAKQALEVKKSYKDQSIKVIVELKKIEKSHDDRGARDIDILLKGMETRRDDNEAVYRIIRELKKKDGEPPHSRTVIDRAREAGLPEERTGEILKKLKEEGYIYSPDNQDRVDTTGSY